MYTAKVIREIRVALNLSVGQFAAKLGVSENCVWKWESGARHPSYKRMVKLDSMARKVRAPKPTA